MKNLKFSLILLLSSIFSTSLLALEMDLKKIDGSIDKLSQYKGKWIVVNYWATWCPPCVEEMPELQAFHDDHKDKDAVVIGINSEDVKDAKLLQFLDDYFITYPSYVTKPAGYTPFGRLEGYPSTYVVSPSGTVEGKQVGGITKEVLEHFIDNWKSE